MSFRRSMLIAALLLLTVLVALSVPTGLPWLLVHRSVEDLDAPPYGASGPHYVGMRSLALDDGTPVPLTMWYPALSGDKQITTARYPYRVKMGDPIGTVSIASYSGQAITDAPYDLSENPYPSVILSPGFALGTTTYA